MQLSAWARPPGQPLYDSRQLLRLASALSFSVTGLDQVLRTVTWQLSAHPIAQLQAWTENSLMALPLFAAAIWAGDWAASRAGIGLAQRSAVCKRALLIALFAAAAQIPLWLWRNKVDHLARAQALVTPHSHGSIDVYWASPGVIVALACVCLVPAAIWAGRDLASRLVPRSRHTAGAAFLRASVPVLLVAGTPVLTWLLHQAAAHAYASQVYYTRALLAVPVHSHAVPAGSHLPPGPPVTTAPFSFIYQIAHAIQDGLAGQAAGLPVTAITLLLGTRWMRCPHQQPDSGKEEPQ